MPKRLSRWMQLAAARLDSLPSPSTVDEIEALLVALGDFLRAGGVVRAPLRRRMAAIHASLILEVVERSIRGVHEAHVPASLPQDPDELDAMLPDIEHLLEDRDEIESLRVGLRRWSLEVDFAASDALDRLDAELASLDDALPPLRALPLDPVRLLSERGALVLATLPPPPYARWEPTGASGSGSEREQPAAPAALPAPVLDAFLADGDAADLVAAVCRSDGDVAEQVIEAIRAARDLRQCSFMARRLEQRLIRMGGAQPPASARVLSSLRAAQLSDAGDVIEIDLPADGSVINLGRIPKRRARFGFCLDSAGPCLLVWPEVDVVTELAIGRNKGRNASGDALSVSLGRASREQEEILIRVTFAEGTAFDARVVFATEE